MNYDFSTLPQNKAELIDRIRVARAALEDTFRLLSAEDLARPGPDGGWSIQDHLAHLAEWRWKLLAMMAGRPGSEGLKIDTQTYANAGIDGINAILYERNHSRPTAEILADFQRAHAAVLEDIEQMDEAGLRRAYDLSDPSDTRILLEGIIGNTYAHDLEHLQWISALIASL